MIWAPVLAGVVTVAVVTAALAWLLPRLVRRGVVDEPNLRSSHAEVTPRGGGAAILLGLIAGLLTFALTGGWVNWTVQTLAGAAAALALVGFVEDLRGLTMILRLAAQTAIPGLALAWLSYHGMLGLSLRAGLITAAVCLATAVFYVNAANFLDGVNGISAMHAVVVGGYFAALGMTLRHDAMIGYAVLFAAAFGAFLPWNAVRAKLFMGDSGSYLLGAGVWGLAVLGLTAGLDPVVVGAPMVIYGADVVFTLIRRLIRRENISLAHREHVYQRLQQLTGSHLAAAGWVTLFTVGCLGAGAWAQASGSVRYPLVVMGLLAVGYLASPWLLRLVVAPRKAPT